nr:hypothetical protein [Tanacetum cinerariifolium]
MADNQTMAELLQAPTEGYEDAIVIPEITANNFELKHGLINLVQNKQFFGNDKEDPHAHIRACLHYGFSELHQLDTFYNALNINDQDSLNSTVGGNFLDKMPRECLKVIESKSKVRQSRAKAVIAKIAPTPSTTPAPVKAVEPNCVTCGGTHSYQNCPATHENTYRDNIQEYVSQAAATSYNQGNTGFRPHWGSYFCCVNEKQDFQHCRFAYFLSQVEPRSVAQALEDPSWVDAMQEEMQQFKFQNVWVLVDLPAEAIRLFLAFASYMGFLVYQMDVKNAFLYGRTDEEVYVTQPKGFMDPKHPKKVYKVVKALYGLHQAPRAWTETTPYEAPKPKSKNESDSPVNVYLYRSMIGSLIASGHDIMFAISACSRHQVTPTTSNLEAVKKIFKYLKGQPKLGLWYPKESPLVLEAYSDSDYDRANKDRKFTTGGSTLRAPELGSPAILATIDKIAYTITEELVRSHLQLTDDRGILLVKLHFRGMVSNIGNAKKFLMYPRFLQTILGIETRVTKQYKVLVFSSKLFSNMRLNFVGHSMPLLPAMLLQAQAGGGAEVAEQAVPHPMPSPNHSPAPLPTPSRPQTSDPVAQVLEHDHHSDKHETAAGSFPSRVDAPLGGDFHPSPPRSSHALPTGQPSGGKKDPITLTALSSVVSTLMQKVHLLEAELHNHKNLFKDVMGKLVKKVKTLEVKLKTKKRKMVVSDSDQDDGTTQNVDLYALRALANAALAADSDIPSGNTLQFPANSLQFPAASPYAPPAGPTAVPADSPKVPIVVLADSPNVPAGVSSKGKSLMGEEDIPVKARTFRQMEEDRLGEEAAKRLHEEEMAKIERERAKAQRKRQQEVLESSMFYNKADWLNIRAQVEANASLSKTLLGDDVSEDNFPAQMAALIKKKRQALAEQLFKERQNRPMTPAQQKAYMRQYVKNQSSDIYYTGWTMAGERKTRKGQNRNKTRRKREAWKSPAMSKSIHSQESRKREENTVSRD